MKHWIEQQVSHAPHKIAIQQGDVELTYEELFNDSKNKAHYIKQLQLKRVGLYIKNDIKHASLIIAAWLANVEVVMINTKLTPVEIEQQLNSIAVQTVFTFKPLHIKQNCIDIEDIHIDDSKHEEYDFTIDMDDIATIMFTSGTTGPAKAVPQTFSNHYFSAMGCKESLGYDESTRWLSVLPIYHISGLSVLIRSLIEGFTLIFRTEI